MYSNTCDCYAGCTCGGWKQLVGRVLIASPFLVAGWMKLTGFAGTVGYVASAGFPAPEILTVLAIIVELGGALALIAGLHARTAALGLIAFTIIATLGYHLNWSDPMQMTMFLKNLAIIGGLTYVFAHGANKMSLRSWDRYCWGGKMCPDCKVAKS
ncbi:MAG: DoxX family protein [Candidatus Kaiserbacteria bacterium]|nr:MAG: DoxX family protein [Candidatus Kaiserbacteria bacterium]